MVMWVFGYGSLIWKAGFRYDERLVGFIKGYRRVFYQGSTDHRGTPEYPGRTVTLEPAEGEVCWGAAYKVSREEDERVAIEHLEVREKQYDVKSYVDFFTDPNDTTPAVSGVMVYIASPDKQQNQNYLGPASLEELANQIIKAKGPSGPNRDYLFHLEKALLEMATFVSALQGYSTSSDSVLKYHGVSVFDMRPKVEMCRQAYHGSFQHGSTPPPREGIDSLMMNEE